MKMYCLEPEGSFGSQVADAANRRYFDGTADIALCKTNVDILAAVANAKSYAMGIVPVRNSSAGLVADVVRFWLNGDRDRPLSVIGEVDLPVHHHLLVRQGVSLRDVTRIVSHAQGLAQCEQRLSRWRFVYEQRRAVASTSLAAKMVSEDQEFAHAAAISSRQCAREFGLAILEENIEDAQDNTTRFHIVANGPGVLPAWKYDSDVQKMAVVWTVKNQTGTLHKVLGEIHEARLNMEFITSIQFGGMNDVAFYVEMDAPRKEEEQERILQAISRVAETIVCLGVFPKGTTIEE